MAVCRTGDGIPLQQFAGKLAIRIRASLYRYQNSFKIPCPFRNWPSEFEFFAKLLLEDQGGSTDSFPFEVDSNLDTVGDSDERNAFIHSVILTIESHCPFDLT
jgi:hypothetical protein